MYLVDTNILVNQNLSAYIDLTKQEKGLLNFLRKIPPIQLYIPDFIITEFALVMIKVVPRKYNLQDKKLLRNLHISTGTIIKEIFLKKTNVITPTLEELTYATDLFITLGGKYLSVKGKTQTISYPDLLLITIAKARELSIITGDKEVQKFFKKQNVPFAKTA